MAHENGLIKTTCTLSSINVRRLKATNIEGARSVSAKIDVLINRALDSFFPETVGHGSTRKAAR